MFKKTVFLALLFTIIFSCKKEKYEAVKTLDISKEKAKFVGSENCSKCHAKAFKQWQNSHHDLAMQEADSLSVLGDFNNTVFESKNISFRFFKKKGDYYVNTEGVGGKYEDYKIVYTFGVKPLQQYLIEFPGGKYQCLVAAWDSEKNKWFDLQPSLKIHHEEWMHWTGGSMTWNNMCADCHSTNLHKNYDSNSETYNTSYSIIDVSCEACHGPASNHVEYYNHLELYKNIKPPKLYMDGATTSKDLVQKCARCHSRRSQLTKFFNYEGHFFDHYKPSLLTPPIYEQDGQIKDEDYVYGSFVQSKMYHNGVSCTDCHNAHTLKLKKTGNHLCLSCHTPDYNEPAHHFHKKNTEASQCINCHMTGKTYMGNDFRRDHSFRVPRPDQTLKYGTPNACNGCHKNKDAKWASNFIISKFGNTRPEHFSDDLLAGYHGDKSAFYKVFTNNNYPEIARATALNQYSNFNISENEMFSLLRFLNDSLALVRNEAITLFDKSQNLDFSKNIEPLLKDSLRMNRISAARYFTTKNIKPEHNTNFIKAKKELENELKINADFPSGQHQIALQHQANGNIDKAIEAYYQAIKIDNYYNMSRINLALLEYNKGNTEVAKNLFLKVIEQEPEYSYPYYMLGLLYNEINAPEKSLLYLKQACDKTPLIPKAFYNYALKLQEKSLYKESVQVIDKALNVYAYDEGLLYVKLIALLKLNNKEKAKTICEKLLQISPNNSRYKEIFSSL